MFSALGLAALAAMAQAGVPTKPLCEFSLTAYGASAKGASGVVGQLYDGQNRIGQCNLPIPKARYSLDSQGRVYDSESRGCILTPPTTQQCDVGAKPDSGFYVKDGDLAYNGSTIFWTCPTGDHGGWNIYSKPVEHQDACVEVWLKVNTESGDCGNGPKTCTKSKTSTQTSTSTKTCSQTKPSTSIKTCLQTKTSTSTKVCKPTEAPKHEDCHCNHSDKPKHEHSHCDHCSQTKKDADKCPGALSKHFEFPHLIIPVDSAKPSKSYTTSFNGTASGTVSSIFNFDIPASAAGKMCSLDFLFPKQSQLETSAFSLTGSGEVEFSVLEAAVTSGTTCETKPKTHQSFGSIKLAPGNAYHIAEYECAAGSTVAFELKAKDDTCLNYFQDFNPCPIGLYINVL